MPNYQDSILYYIQSTTENQIYIGSTTQRFQCRINGHKRGNSISQLILRTNDCDYGIIEKYPCNTREELMWRERYWIEKCQNCFDVINDVKPIRTPQEKEDYYKNWRNNNAEKVIRNRRKRDKRRHKWSFGFYEGKTQGWDNNLLDIDVNLFN